MTREELSQLRDLNREIRRDQLRLAELEAAAKSVTGKITGIPGSAKSSDRVGDYAAEIADLRGIIASNIQRCWYELNRLHRYIASIEDSQMRQIMTLRYVYGYTWQRVAFEIGETDEQYPRRKHNRYLALDDNDENDETDVVT